VDYRPLYWQENLPYSGFAGMKKIKGTPKNLYSMYRHQASYCYNWSYEFNVQHVSKNSIGSYQRIIVPRFEQVRYLNICMSIKYGNNLMLQTNMNFAIKFSKNCPRKHGGKIRSF
jgi:hypothetical protein